MGLDGVELVLAIEDAFGVAISDEEATAMATPGEMVDFLVGRVSGSAVKGCLEQRAFYRIRRAGMQVLGRSRSAFSPKTPWAELIHAPRIDRQWQTIGRVAGIDPWPRVRPLLSWGPPTKSVGDTARAVAVEAPTALLREGEGWSRTEIAAKVEYLVKRELGLRSFKWNDTWRELGV